MFETIKSLISKVIPRQKPAVVAKQWRTGMWVIFNTKVAILVKIDAPCTIHMVDPITGLTIEEVHTSLDSLRQATYEEIPLVRRGFSKETARGLGYGS